MNILDVWIDDTKIQVKFEFGVRRSKVTAHYLPIGFRMMNFKNYGLLIALSGASVSYGHIKFLIFPVCKFYQKFDSRMH